MFGIAKGCNEAGLEIVYVWQGNCNLELKATAWVKTPSEIKDGISPFSFL